MHAKSRVLSLLVVSITMAVASSTSQAAANVKDSTEMSNTHITQAASDVLTTRQQSIAPIAAFAASGDMGKLNSALNQGLDAGLTVSDAKEILVQLYAYAGFPRSLNALGELMKVLDARRHQGIQDADGAPPSHVSPKGEALLAAGTANQTKLAGAPVKGPLFEFAPAIDEYLKTHLFGDIFERDNLDWKSRELATVGMLSALSGAESQLQSHIRISMNVGLSAGQLELFAQVLTEKVDADNGRRTREALNRHLASLRK
jgi:alkylhydroperoxidase/carboxymuconolactone decarboxylase family protein YurZ